MASPTSPVDKNLRVQTDVRPRGFSLHNTVTNEKEGSRSFEETTKFPLLAPGNTQDGAYSPIADRAEANRLNDDLELLRAERLISHQENQERTSRQRSRTDQQQDIFNQPDVVDSIKKKDTDAMLYRIWIFLRKYPRIVRYIVYLLPGAALLLTPVLLGALKYNKGEHAVGGLGGVYLMWFGIWLEIVWASLWVSRMITSLMPPIFHGIAKIMGSGNAKKWRDIGSQLELHTALFLWFLAILISFKPTCAGHRVYVQPDRRDDVHDNWIDIVNKVIIALFVLATLNMVEKIIIQWIATSFHQRTYATRIENHRGDIGQLVHLFEFAKSKLEYTDSFWQGESTAPASGAQTPMRMFHENARQVVGKIGQVAGRVGNDLIGRKVTVHQPSRVVAELLRNTGSSHTLARLMYRSLVQEGKEMVYPEDMQNAFQSSEEAEAAFGVFDKDLNGDISLEEFEAVCNEIHLEKKAIAASLKDLDSVTQKLDRVFLFIIVVIAIVVFVSILSGSAAAGLASASTSILGLAWVLQATAQEFLQSIIFVFVKHPFDVGDRVTIYGNTGDLGRSDDYYVTEISLLYTEFKKMQGQIVQAPNSMLNTLFILNQRRSNGLADVVPLIVRFGTPSYLIEDLKARMLEFCKENKRDYRPQILSELTGIDQVRAASFNIIFFHKSSYQNELLRLTRHNRFVSELMDQMVALGIQGPYRTDPGGSREYPMFYTGSQPPAYANSEHSPYAHTGEAPVPDVPTFSNMAPTPVASTPEFEPRAQRSASMRSERPSISGRAAANAAAASLGDIGDFGDVYDSRRDRMQVQRLASIREKEVGTLKEAEAEAEAEATGSEVRRSTSIRLGPASSQDTLAQRSRFFGRHRSRSQGRQSSEIV